jgi:peptidoglycan L-alanyl-D-glutamate endopeptidase CwlK
MDYVSEQRLGLVHPVLMQKIHALSDSLSGQGIEIRVVQGLRNWADQEKLYAQGRTEPGEIVTYAPPGHSMHEFGLAVDCEPSLNGPAGPYLPDGIAGSPRYVAMVAIAEAEGLVSGSRWSHPVDWPHLQLPNAPASPTNAMRADFAAGGLSRVWENYDQGAYKP